MQNPIILTLAYTTGLLLGHGFLYFPYSIAVFVILILLTLGISAWLSKLSFPRSLLFVIPGLIGMAAYIYSAVWLPADHYIRLLSDDKNLHQITGRIASGLDRDPDRTAFVLDLREIDSAKVSGKVRVSVREPLRSIGYDDSVRISGKLYRPRGFDNPGVFDYPSYLARNGIYRTVSVRSGDQIQVVTPGQGIFRTIQDWRERIRQAFLASTSGPGSAILQAMVLGEEGGLTDEMRDRFLAAGVTHIISISGSHLGMAALICFGLIRLFMRILPERIYLLLTIYADPKKIAAWITLPLVLFYTLLAGGQIATVRSLMMIVAGLAALVLDRESALIHALAVAALLILVVSPQALFDISFQLSFISVLTIGGVVLVWKELGFTGAGRLRKLWQNGAVLTLISFSTALVTGPIVVHYFNQFSLAGIVSNLVVVPFAGMAVVPLGLFSGILSLFIRHLPFAGLNQFAADAFVDTVAFFSRLPLAEFHPPSPGVLWLLCYALLIVSLFKLVRAWLLFSFKPLEHSRRISKQHAAAIVLTSFFLITSAVSGSIESGKARVSIVDVGQGDCSLIQFPEGRNVLIDGGGTYDDRFDTGRRIVAPFLWNRGVRTLDLVILSHPHPDHMNGLKYILKKFNVHEVWTHGRDSDLPGYDEFNKAVVERNVKQTIVSGASQSSFEIGAASLRVLHPAQTFRSREKKDYAAENDSSLVVRISVLNRVLIFSGDIGPGAEKAMLGHALELKCDVLKVPHHGSKSSSSQAFVAAARPSTAIVAVGKGNPYHHPSDEVLKRYENAGSRVYRTDRDGAVFITLDGNEVKTTRWNSLKLQQVFPTGQAKEELENGKRLWLRKWEL